MTASEQITAIRQELTTQLARHHRCWSQDVLPKLTQNGIHLLHYHELVESEREQLRQYFVREVFPTLTPLAFDPASSVSAYFESEFQLGRRVRDPERGECFARVKLPDVFPRLIPVMRAQAPSPGPNEFPPPKGQSFVWFEEIVAAHVATVSGT